MTERFITHFENDEANFSQSILLELMTILGRYRESIYLVGGWAPYFLLKRFQKNDNIFQHAGSIDIDLAIDFAKVSQNQYAGIVELIEKRGYKSKKDKYYDETNSDLKMAAISYCGNSTVSGLETCDDGNLTSSDGCSNLCQTE